MDTGVEKSKGWSESRRNCRICDCGRQAETSCQRGMVVGEEQGMKRDRKSTSDGNRRWSEIKMWGPSYATTGKPKQNPKNMKIQATHEKIIFFSIFVIIL